jgi:hypothetical protein
VNRRIIVQPEAAEHAKGIFTYLAKNRFSVARRFNEAAADTLLKSKLTPVTAFAGCRPRLGCKTFAGKRFAALSDT